jgi:hypothetical protein
MSEKEGTLRMMASGRWVVYRPGGLLGCQSRSHQANCFASNSPAN